MPAQRLLLRLGASFEVGQVYNVIQVATSWLRDHHLLFSLTHLQLPPSLPYRIGLRHVLFVTAGSGSHRSALSYYRGPHIYFLILALTYGRMFIYLTSLADIMVTRRALTATVCHTDRRSGGARPACVAPAHRVQPLASRCGHRGR